ncbi:hypothetical protein AMK16_20915 [Streptomyces sp. CB00455]|uniref:SDR family NAD(P)-dependent oxidoreductase n=1 Tax=Streptomyces sp. CB00455 TaxID=1703927 RepID=UPI00093FB7A9|nr:SDR family oxidoreductase [Streptomyces sp. CB00455]OKK17727.1 hypothetical protein AMK16_20915 [Streptomyces sp. CB00455]
MSLDGVRILVAGATGELGGRAVAELARRGAALAVAGRDRGRLVSAARTGGDAPMRRFDAYALDQCAELGPWAAGELGGLDGVLVTVGVAGFGPAASTPDAVGEHLLTVNALCPMAVLRGALPALTDGGFLAAVTGRIVDRPLRGTADLAASKAALGCWLGVLGREVKDRGVLVLDLRPPHLATGFAGRAVAGSAPALPAGADPARETVAWADRLTAHMAQRRVRTG